MSRIVIVSLASYRAQMAICRRHTSHIAHPTPSASSSFSLLSSSTGGASLTIASTPYQRQVDRALIRTDQRRNSGSGGSTSTDQIGLRRSVRQAMMTWWGIRHWINDRFDGLVDEWPTRYGSVWTVTEPTAANGAARFEVMLTDSTVQPLRV